MLGSSGFSLIVDDGKEGKAADVVKGKYSVNGKIDILERFRSKAQDFFYH